MTRANTQIPDWWPASLRSWFAQELTRTDLTAEERTRLKRLAMSSTMEPVAKRLTKEEKLSKRRGEHWKIDPFAYPNFLPIRDPLIPFMARSWHAPTLWQSLQNSPRTKPNSSARRSQLSKLKQACDRFCEILQLHEDVGTTAIDVYCKETRPYRRPEERFAELMATLQAIGRVAGEGFAVNWEDDLERVLPAKMKDPRAEEVFCIRYITNDADTVFGKPLYAEVAILVTHLLKLDNEVSPERVKELWKTKKGGNSEEPF